MSDATEPAPARPSATIMLVRDGARGLEVFMVVRERPMDGAMGALVFPGGKVDAEDDGPAWCAATPPVAAPGRRYWIAAIRETFEEAGLLIATRRDQPDMLIDAATAADVVARHRIRLLDCATGFAEILAEEALVPALSHLVPFAHWQTPVDLPKRFDTHFFLVAAPPGQQPLHDGREMADGFWIAAGDIIAEAAAGKRVLVPATRFNLELLAESRTVAEAIAAARARRIVTVLPRRVVTPDGPRMMIPPEAGYPASSFPSRRG